jgi:peroxiredoxin Q/BCP
MLGQPAPDFELPNQDGQLVHLRDYRGKKVIVFAFPMANSSGCNAQACSFRDEFFAVQSSKAVILGVSPDITGTLRQWKIDKKLPYDLLSDAGHRMLSTWGAWGIPIMGSVKIPMVNRSYWVIDERGIVIDEQYKVDPRESVRLALAAVGEVTPLG